MWRCENLKDLQDFVILRIFNSLLVLLLVEYLLLIFAKIFLPLGARCVDISGAGIISFSHVIILVSFCLSHYSHRIAVIPLGIRTVLKMSKGTVPAASQNCSAAKSFPRIASGDLSLCLIGQISSICSLKLSGLRKQIIWQGRIKLPTMT